MANNFSTQILTDTNKRTVIKLTGQLDATGETANVKIQGRNLRGALAVDTNNAVLVSAGGVPRASYNLAVRRIVYDVGIPNGYVTLNWDGATPGPIAILWSSYDLNLDDNLGLIRNNAITPNGNISLTATGSNTTSSYTIVIELVKNGVPGNNDFDMGQVAKPADFNFGSYGIRP